MERVSRFTQADIVASVDRDMALVSKNALGFCHTFKTQCYTLPDGTVRSCIFYWLGYLLNNVEPLLRLRFKYQVLIRNEIKIN